MVPIFVMDIVHSLIIFVAGVIAGSFGTLVGGGGLITIPALVLLGLSPHTAIGTNMLGMTGIGTAGWYKFHKKGVIHYKIGLAMGVPTMIGSFVGANIVLNIDEAILKHVIAVITILVLIFIMIINPRVGIEELTRPVRNSEYLLGAFMSFFIGIYGGFYPPGSATFLSYVLLLIFRKTFLESAGTAKIPTLFFTTMAAVIFALNEVIMYPLAIALFIGSFLGSYAGAHYSERIGNIWIKRLFFAIVLAMAIKMIS